jgi:antirestriction protein
MTEIYVANLGKYNEGELVGGWIELPATEQEWHDLMVAIGLGSYDESGEYRHGVEVDGVVYEEYAIHDYSSDIDGVTIGEYDSIDELNGLFEEVEKLNEYEKEHLEAIIEASGNSLRESLDELAKGDTSYYRGLDVKGLAEEFVDEGLFSTETLMRYIDYEALARDLEFDGYTETKNGVLWRG